MLDFMSPFSFLSWILWGLFAALIAFWAHKWNRSAVGYGLATLFLSPLLTAIVLLIVGKSGPPCPHCGGSTIKNANVCKNCGRDIGTVEVLTRG